MSIQQWNDASGSYMENQESSAFAAANRAIVKERFKKLNGETVLDLACGYGYYTDYFKSIGARVIGVDGAAAMIDLAKKRYPDSSFAVSDLARPLPFEPCSFDLVFCNQALMDIEHIGVVFAECRRILKPEGVLWFSIVHPAFFNGDWQTDENGYQIGKLITSYITPFGAENHFWGETKHFHRPISDYLNAAADAGFVLIHTEEPKVYDRKTRNDDLPLFFFAEYKKGAALQRRCF